MKAILEQNANVVFMVNLNNLFLVSLSVMVEFILSLHTVTVILMVLRAFGVLLKEGLPSLMV